MELKLELGWESDKGAAEIQKHPHLKVAGGLHRAPLSGGVKTATTRLVAGVDGVCRGVSSSPAAMPAMQSQSTCRRIGSLQPAQHERLLS